jgi:hypothetical protein
MSRSECREAKEEKAGTEKFETSISSEILLNEEENRDVGIVRDYVERRESKSRYRQRLN